jgi:hypothetical protein
MDMMVVASKVTVPVLSFLTVASSVATQDPLAMPAFAHFGVFSGLAGFAAATAAIVSQLDSTRSGPKTRPVMSMAATALGALGGGGAGIFQLESAGPNVALGWAIGVGITVSLALHGRDVAALVKSIRDVIWPK